MADGRHVYYQRDTQWMVLDTRTRVERPIDLPAGAEEFRLSPDSKRAYMTRARVQGDIWMLEFK